MAATRRLSSLERALGVRLVHRSTRALALTPEGDAFLPHAAALLEAQEAAYESVRGDGAAATGLLRVTTSIAFGRRVAAPVLARFLDSNPAARVELVMTDDIVDIVPAGIDLAIRIANLADSSLVARRLARNPRLLLASEAYLGRHGQPRTLADLAGHECIATTGTRHWTFATGGGAVRVPAGGRFSSNSIEGLLQACVGGVGIANLSAWCVQEEVMTGAVRRIELADAEPEELDVWAVYPTSLLVPPKVRLFVDALAAELRAW